MDGKRVATPEPAATHEDLRASIPAFEDVTYMNVIERQLKVMDMTAISLAMDNDLPLAVFNLNQADNIRKVICGESVGTLIHS